jgi:hypothetical protein
MRKEEIMITKFGTGTFLCMVAVMVGCAATADDSVTIDISAYTTNATRMCVLEDHTLAVLDGANKQIFLLQPDGTYIKTIDISDYTLNPVDIAAFTGRIGVLDTTGLPNVAAGHILLFNRSGFPAVNLPGSPHGNYELNETSPPTEVVPFISGAYALTSDFTTNVRTSCGELYSASSGGNPRALGTSDSNEYWMFILIQPGEYRLYRELPMEDWEDPPVYITIPTSDWGGDTISLMGMASFGGNHFGLINEQQTSLIYMNTVDGYIDRIDNLPTASSTILDVEGDLRSNDVYLLSASRIIKIPVAGVDPLGFNVLLSASQTDDIEFTWRKDGNYKLYIYDSIADTVPAQIIDITDTMPAYSYSIGAEDERFFRLIAQ